MLLLTGATGTVGRVLLPRLTAAGTPVRCLVRDPRRPGLRRAGAEILVGDLGDPRALDDGLRGVDTVVHLAATIRDQPGGSIEELNALATLRLVRAAERAGARRFVFFSTLSAARHSPARFMRAKALAEQAVTGSSLAHTVFAPSIIYAPGDPYLTLLGRMSRLPVMPIPGAGRTAFEPIWAQDVAACVVAALQAPDAAGARYELAGPETLTHAELVQTVLRARNRPRPIVPVPMALTRRALRLAAHLGGPTPDEAELMDVSLLSERGTEDARRLGIEPKRLPDVLGAESPYMR